MSTSENISSGHWPSIYPADSQINPPRNGNGRGDPTIPNKRQSPSFGKDSADDKEDLMIGSGSSGRTSPLHDKVTNQTGLLLPAVRVADLHGNYGSFSKAHHVCQLHEHLPINTDSNTPLDISDSSVEEEEDKAPLLQSDRGDLVSSGCVHQLRE